MGCSSVKKESDTLSNEQLQSSVGKFQKDAIAEIKYTTLKILKEGDVINGLEIEGNYKILPYQNDQQNILNISLIINGKSFLLFTQQLKDSSNSFSMEENFSDFIMTQLAEANVMKVRIDVMKILDEEMNIMQELGRITSEEIKYTSPLTKEPKSISDEELKAFFNPNLNEERAKLSYSTLDIIEKDNLPDKIILKGQYEITKYQPNQKYLFQIFLVLDNHLIMCYEEPLKKERDSIFIEQPLTDYLKLRLSNVSKIKVKLMISKAFGTNLDYQHRLYEFVSDEIGL